MIIVIKGIFNKYIKEQEEINGFQQDFVHDSSVLH